MNWDCIVKILVKIADCLYFNIKDVTWQTVRFDIRYTNSISMFPAKMEYITLHTPRVY